MITKTRRPKIGAQHRAGNPPARPSLNLDTPGGLEFAGAGDALARVTEADTKDGGDGFEGDTGDKHATILDKVGRIVNPFCVGGHNGHKTQHLDMTWTQRNAFRQRLAEYKARTGQTSEQVAPLIGVSPSTLDKYLYAKARQPGPKVLVAASKLFGCPVADFFVPPAQAAMPAGLDALDQYRFDQIIERLSSPELSPADRQILFEDFVQAYDRLVVLKASIARRDPK